MTGRHSETAFETVIEAHLLENGYESVPREGFDRERAVFPQTVLTFIKDTQPREWAKLEALHGEKTGEQILGDLCKWMDANGALATPRSGSASWCVVHEGRPGQGIAAGALRKRHLDRSGNPSKLAPVGPHRPFHVRISPKCTVSRALSSSWSLPSP